MLYAAPESFFERLKSKKNSNWHCPRGHSIVFKDSELFKLKRELQTAHKRADEFQRRAAEQRERAESIGRSYKRVRERVKNGVCPCCNRTFENLARHMKTKHPEYGTHQQLRTIRLAYGLTQTQVADEVGVNAAYVSLYERGMELPKSSKFLLDEWVSKQSAA
jgi:DNA-binding transcriptional regulator YiaG